MYWKRVNISFIFFSTSAIKFKIKADKIKNPLLCFLIKEKKNDSKDIK